MTGVPEAVVVTFRFPQAAPVQFDPLNVQLTPEVLFTTVAVKFCPEPPEATVAVVGETVTETATPVMVMVELADLVESVTEVAVRDTVGGLGGLAGAV
jgi:hypothetical protein